METIRLTTQWLPHGGGLNTEALEVPIGTIIAFMGNTPPENYLACDGNTYRIADYRPLANFINLQFGSFNYFGGDGVDTFAVPDLRGEFLRGTGTNSHANSGDGDSVGVHQVGTSMPSMGWAAYPNNVNWIGGTYDANAGNHILVANWDYAVRPTTGSMTLKVSKSPGYFTNIPSAYTTRPTNTSVLYCIKYKNS